MQEVKTDRGVFLLWETDKELPIDRYSDFQKYAIQAIGIGSNMQSVNDHFKTLDVLLSNSKIDEARSERYNLHFNIFVALERIQIDHLMFAVCVHSIDGKKIDDYSEEGLKRVCKLLSEVGLNRGLLETLLEGLKKKLIEV